MNIVVSTKRGKVYTPQEVQQLIDRCSNDKFQQVRPLYPLHEELADFLEAVKTILESQPDVNLIVDGKHVKTAYYKPVTWPVGILANLGV